MSKAIEKFGKNLQRTVLIKTQLQVLVLVQRLQDELLATPGSPEEHRLDVERTEAVRRSLTQDLSDFVLHTRDADGN